MATGNKYPQALNPLLGGVDPGPCVLRLFAFGPRFSRDALYYNLRGFGGRLRPSGLRRMQQEDFPIGDESHD
jgi:hypothetical protein